MFVIIHRYLFFLIFSSHFALLNCKNVQNLSHFFHKISICLRMLADMTAITDTSLKDSSQQEEFCQRIQKEGMSVRKTEEAVREVMAESGDILQMKGKKPNCPIDGFH